MYGIPVKKISQKLRDEIDVILQESKKWLGADPPSLRFWEVVDSDKKPDNAIFFEGLFNESGGGNQEPCINLPINVPNEMILQLLRDGLQMFARWVSIRRNSNYSGGTKMPEKFFTQPVPLQGDGSSKIRGLASAYGNVVHSEMGDTLFWPGAYQGALIDFKKKGIPLLWSHDVSKPIGKITALFETISGLEFSADLIDVTEARDAKVRLKEGLGTGISIGFDSLNLNFFPEMVSY
jgi:HK97 family phage prohead protease